jgi:hypothetical protein
MGKRARRWQDTAGYILALFGGGVSAATPCYAWAFLSNHLHLLLRTGNAPIATLMRKVLTGYVVSLNRRYRRNGYPKSEQTTATGHGSECIVLLGDPGVGYEWK